MSVSDASSTEEIMETPTEPTMHQCNRCGQTVRELTNIGCNCEGPIGCRICRACENETVWDKKHRHNMSM